MKILQAMAFGDAMGAPFETPDGSRHRDANAWDGEHFLPTPRLKLEPGQWTDDTTLAVALAQKLVNECPPTTPNLRHAYTAAYEANPNVGWGNTLAKALSNSHPIQFNPHASGWTIGNGALMRMPVYGYVPRSMDDDKLKDLIQRDAMLTHPHDDVLISCIAYVRILNRALDGDFSTARACRVEAEEMLYGGAGYVEFSAELRRTVAGLLMIASGSDYFHLSYMVLDSLSKGSVFETLASTLFIACARSNVRTIFDAVKSAIRVGGDTDTRAALVAPFFEHLPFGTPEEEKLAQREMLAELDEKLTKLRAS